mmetsp:Transcript_27238/g.72315  ORF Transcript_27238/g.72315 Transcript_27238/m.72315 type:complete len:281 (-) Transcript_27238:2-844(-)
MRVEGRGGSGAGHSARRPRGLQPHPQPPRRHGRGQGDQAKAAAEGRLRRAHRPGVAQVLHHLRASARASQGGRHRQGEVGELLPGPPRRGLPQRRPGHDGAPRRQHRPSGGGERAPGASAARPREGLGQCHLDDVGVLHPEPEAPGRRGALQEVQPLHREGRPSPRPVHELAREALQGQVGAGEARQAGRKCRAVGGQRGDGGRGPPDRAGRPHGPQRGKFLLALCALPAELPVGGGEDLPGAVEGRWRLVMCSNRIQCGRPTERRGRQWARRIGQAAVL